MRPGLPGPGLQQEEAAEEARAQARASFALDRATEAWTQLLLSG